MTKSFQSNPVFIFTHFTHFSMRKNLLLLILFAASVCSHANGQSAPDISSVLQKCIDLPGLIDHYPQNGDGSCKQIVVMQHAVSFPSGTDVTLSGVPVLFKSKQEVMSSDSPYFLFWDFTLSANTARIAFSFYFDRPGSDTSVAVNVYMEKSGSEWQVVNSEFERR